MASFLTQPSISVLQSLAGECRHFSAKTAPTHPGERDRSLAGVPQPILLRGQRALPLLLADIHERGA